jgi:ribonuclease P protein component
MSLRIYTGCEATSFKCGFSVRKRDYKRAVDRNKVKRRLREIVRIARPQLLPALWLVIMAHKGVATAKWADLRDEFYALCEKKHCFFS